MKKATLITLAALLSTFYCMGSEPITGGVGISVLDFKLAGVATVKKPNFLGAEIRYSGSSGSSMVRGNNLRNEYQARFFKGGLFFPMNVSKIVDLTIGPSFAYHHIDDELTFFHESAYWPTMEHHLSTSYHIKAIDANFGLQMHLLPYLMAGVTYRYSQLLDQGNMPNVFPTSHPHIRFVPGLGKLAVHNRNQNTLHGLHFDFILSLGKRGNLIHDTE